LLNKKILSNGKKLNQFFDCAVLDSCWFYFRLLAELIAMLDKAMSGEH